MSFSLLNSVLTFIFLNILKTPFPVWHCVFLMSVSNIMLPNPLISVSNFSFSIPLIYASYVVYKSTLACRTDVQKTPSSKKVVDEESEIKSKSCQWIDILCILITFSLECFACDYESISLTLLSVSQSNPIILMSIVIFPNVAIIDTIIIVVIINTLFEAHVLKVAPCDPISLLK